MVVKDLKWLRIEKLKNHVYFDKYGHQLKTSFQKDMPAGVTIKAS
jgi:hypothetical protein